jgi:hypothetical protein
MLKRSAAGFIIIIALLLFVAVVVQFSHGSVTPLQPSRPSPIFDSNPQSIVIRGSIIKASIVGDTDEYTEVWFQPYHTALLYKKAVLFCSYLREVNALTNPVIFRYEAIAHHMYQGVGCHDLRKAEHWRKP